MEQPRRKEHDLLGEREIPYDVYWGIHTLRARENFIYLQHPVHARLLAALGQVKQACAMANGELGYLTPEIAAVVVEACREVSEGLWNSQFPLDALQGGAGTSTNMNVNEVVANRALELLGQPKGAYELCHPIEHVNLYQSTNDVYPTACKIALAKGLRCVSEAAALLQGALQHKEQEFSGVVMMGRTEMQDAVPMTMGAQFASWADAVARDRWRTFKSEERIRVVNLGGTAIGSGLAAPRRYIFLVIEKLRMLSGCSVTRGENPLDTTANADVFVEVSGMLGAHAATLRKIANDMRLLHTLGELSLQPLQAGSSMMPGKVNPVILEAVIATAIKVAANHTIVTDCASSGTLQINEFLPLLADALLQSIDLLVAADEMLAKQVVSITANTARCSAHVHRSTAQITALLPLIGYEKAQKLVKAFKESHRTDFRDFLREQLGGDRVDALLTSSALMALGFKD